MNEFNDKPPIQAIIGVIIFFILVVGLIVGLIYMIIVYGLPMFSGQSDTGEDPGIAIETTKVPARELKDPDLNIAFDDEAINRTMNISLSGFDIMRLKLQISGVKQKANLFIPTGIRAIPGSEYNNLPAMIVFSSRTITLEPSEQTNTYYLDAATLSPDNFQARLGGIRYNFTSVKAEDPTVRFFQSVEEPPAHWPVIQTGTWVLNSTATLDDIDSLSVTVKDGISGEPVTTRLAAPETISELRTALEKAGLSPANYPLFKSIEEKRNTFINSINSGTPTHKLIKLLSSKDAASYGDDTRLQQTLLRMSSQHNNAEVRKLTLELLIRTGLTGSEQALLSRAGLKYNLNERFLAAWTLFKKEHKAGPPYLALYAEDSIFGRYCSDMLEKRISEDTRTQKKPGQSMLDYWISAVGWEKLAADYPEADEIRQKVMELVPKEDPSYKTALAEVTSPDPATARKACHTLRKFPREKEAFLVLVKAAQYGKDQSVRYAAVSSLRMFRDFNPSSVCTPLIKNPNADRQLIFAALNLAVSSEFEGYELLFGAALRSKDSYIRREALKYIARQNITIYEDTCYKMSMYDTDESVKKEALKTLAYTRSEKGLRLLEGRIRDQAPHVKSFAVDCLRLYKDDPRALAILDRCKNDPVLGTRIKSHLQRYGR